MHHFIAYYKLAAWGSYDSNTKHFSHYSNRPLTQLKKSIGERIWVIDGEVSKANERKTEYKLLSYFTPKAVELALQQVGWVISGQGVGFEPPIDLSDQPWLDALQT